MLDRFDAAVGDGIERAMIHHHMRRMRRHGQLAASRPRARACGRRPAAPPREGNSLEVLIDGENALPRDGRGDPQRPAPRARLLVAPRARLRPGPARRRRPIKELLAETAERVPVRVLVWAGAPVPVFKPRRGEVKAARDALVKGTKIQCELDACTRLMHCHHEKLVIVDDEVAFVGGIDLTALAGDRYDSNEHPHKEDGDRLARRLLAAARADRARRRRALRPALGGDRRAGARAPRGHRARRRHDRPVRPHRPRGRVRGPPARRVLDPRELHPRAAQRPAPDLPREPVPVVARDRPHPRGQAAQPAQRRLPRRRPAAPQGQQRPGRHARDARPAGRRRRRPQALPRHDDPVAHAASGPARCTSTPRSGSSTTAGWRSAPPTSTSTASSTTPRSTSSPATRASPAPRGCGCGPSTSSATTSTATRRGSSTSTGARSRPSSSSAAARGAPLTHHLVELPGVSRRSRRLLGPLDALVVDG